MNRRGLVAVVAAIAVISAGVGWIAGQRIKSPAEIAAEQAPPEPSLITVPVEMRELSQSLVVRGTARSNDSTPLEASSASGETIITRLTKEAGADLIEGDVAIEVAGRPMFVLQGKLPVFRSLIPTLEGPDVEQLEEALNRLGHDPGTIDGVFDGATADAVEQLYRDAGYKPVEPTDQDLATLKIERQSVDDAVTQVADAQKLLTEANAGPPESVRIQLDQAVTEAEEQLAIAEAAAGVTEAVEARKAAEADAATAATAAETAAARLAQAQGGTHPDTNLPPTDQELAELQAENDAAADAKTAADALVVEAKKTEAEATSGKDKELAQAKTNLALAKATRTEQLATDNAAAAESLKAAKLRLTEARASLAKTQSVVDTQFPAAELYFLPSLPRKIQSLSVEAGQRPNGPVMTVTGAGTSITSAIAASDRRLVSVGDKAILEDDDLGIRADATISFIAESPGGGDTASDRYLMKIDPDEDLPEDALNVNFRITIPVTASDGEVMAVPLAALSAGTDGTTRVEVERSAGETELVRVTAGLKADGFVEINVVGGDLKTGDRVVVGRDLVLPGQTASDSSEDEDALSAGS
ncbi:MAG: peptidoglycan-binding protein [Acidimicrobiales bacterium]